MISRNRGGAYIISELDGSVFDRPVAAFRVIPYFSRTRIDLPPLEELIDISQTRLKQMTDSDVMDPDSDDEEVSDPLDDD